MQLHRRSFVKRGVVLGAGSTLASLLPMQSFSQLLSTHSFDFMDQSHPNLTIIKRFFEAYASNDLDTIQEVLDENIAWHIPGNHPLSGTKNGIAEVMDFFGQLSGAALKAEPIVMGVNDDYVIDCHKNWSELAHGSNFEGMSCLLWHIVNGKVIEVHNFPQNQQVVDHFFTKLLE